MDVSYLFGNLIGRLGDIALLIHCAHDPTIPAGRAAHGSWTIATDPDRDAWFLNRRWDQTNGFCRVVLTVMGDLVTG